MKGVTIAAYLASALLAVAQDDDLGLPQIQVPPPEPEPASGYFVHDGIVYAVIGNEAVPLDREMTLRITPRAIVGFDGRRLHLPEGKMLTFDGRYAPAPVAEPQPVVTPAPSATTTVTTSATTNTNAVAVPDSSIPIAPATGPVVVNTVATEPLPVVPAPQPGQLPTAQSPLSPATIPPPQPPFATPGRPDRTGPLTDSERPVDRTRQESVPNLRDDITRLRDEQRPMDRTRAGTDDTKHRDRTMPGPDDYRRRDRTIQGPDDERPPDITRRPPRN